MSVEVQRSLNLLVCDQLKLSTDFNMNSFDYDTILEEVGEFGPWQKVLFAFMWIPSAASAMAVFMYEFIAYTPKHRYCTLCIS